MGRFRDWVKCLDRYCGKRSMVSKKQLTRVSGVRCKHCGGPVEPSSAARESHAEGNDAKKSQSQMLKAKFGKAK